MGSRGFPPDPFLPNSREKNLPKPRSRNRHPNPPMTTPKNSKGTSVPKTTPTAPTGPEKILEALAQLNKALQEQKDTPVEKILKTLEKSLQGQSCESHLDVDPDLLKEIDRKTPKSLRTPSQTKPESLWGQKQRQIQLSNTGEIHLHTESQLLNETLEKITRKNPTGLLKNFREVHSTILNIPYGSKELLIRDLEYSGWLCLAYLQIQEEEAHKPQLELSKTNSGAYPHNHPNTQALKEKLLETLQAEPHTLEITETLLKTKNLERAAQKNVQKAVKKLLSPLTTREAISLSQEITEGILQKTPRCSERNLPAVRALLNSLHFQALKPHRLEDHPLNRILPVPAPNSKTSSLLLHYKPEGCRLIAIPNTSRTEGPQKPSPSPSSSNLENKPLLEKVRQIKKQLLEAQPETHWQSVLRPIAIGLIIGAITSLIGYLAVQVAFPKMPTGSPDPLQNQTTPLPQPERAQELKPQST